MPTEVFENIYSIPLATIPFDGQPARKQIDQALKLIWFDANRLGLRPVYIPYFKPSDPVELHFFGDGFTYTYFTLGGDFGRSDVTVARSAIKI